jgi:hypothetical protein
MSIKVIDNFEVNVTKPIDNRFVVGSQSFYTNRDSIPYKYSGLRIWDLNDSLPYVWTGATWSNETAAGTVTGSGTAGRLVKFVGSGSSIANSIVSESGTVISVAGSITTTGNITTTAQFSGNGSSITSINANNITTGTLAIGRLPNGSSSQVLLSGTTTPVWTNLSSVTVGSSTNAINATNTTNINVISDSTNSNSLYVPFVAATGNQQLRINTARSIRINPSSGNVYVNGGASIGNIAIVPDTNGLYVQGRYDTNLHKKLNTFTLTLNNQSNNSIFVAAGFVDNSNFPGLEAIGTSAPFISGSTTQRRAMVLIFDIFGITATNKSVYKRVSAHIILADNGTVIFDSSITTIQSVYINTTIIALDFQIVRLSSGTDAGKLQMQHRQNTGEATSVRWVVSLAYQFVTIDDVLNVAPISP